MCVKVVDFVPHIIIASSQINHNHTRREVEAAMVHCVLENLLLGFLNESCWLISSRKNDNLGLLQSLVLHNATVKKMFLWLSFLWFGVRILLFYLINLQQIEVSKDNLYFVMLFLLFATLFSFPNYSYMLAWVFRKQSLFS